jgi:hypothetical protein
MDYNKIAEKALDGIALTTKECRDVLNCPRRIF